jgi:hypothetical protein
MPRIDRRALSLEQEAAREVSITYFNPFKPPLYHQHAIELLTTSVWFSFTASFVVSSIHLVYEDSSQFWNEGLGLNANLSDASYFQMDLMLFSFITTFNLIFAVLVVWARRKWLIAIYALNIGSGGVIQIIDVHEYARFSEWLGKIDLAHGAVMVMLSLVLVRTLWWPNLHRHPVRRFAGGNSERQSSSIGDDIGEALDDLSSILGED